MENTLVRSSACSECGAEMLWTQNAWKTADSGGAAYRCLNGHVMDPAFTRQCPSCGIHDTVPDGQPEHGRFRCTRCGQVFIVKI
jgi:hypothetical protein